jgi:hypothetical protein
MQLTSDGILVAHVEMYGIPKESVGQADKTLYEIIEGNYNKTCDRWVHLHFQENGNVVWY